ncbi:MAG: efflux RND transporter periplasmic adaptor subunit, partial [Deltaproteobacteria bacterium]|nr:efflux RND transporter periplasmic adaptor subunit [Deltaproteobacteria bacterium]
MIRKILMTSVAAAVLLVMNSWPVLAEHSGHGSKPAQEPAKAQNKKTDAVQAPEVMPPTVEIPPDKQKMIALKTATATWQPLQKGIRTVGRIEYDERRLFTINAKIEGWIEKLHVDYTGRFVKKGEPLADIYSPELLATQQEYLNILKLTAKYSKQPSPDAKNDPVGSMLEKDSSALLDAARERLRLWDISERQIRRLEETGKPSRTLTLYSPVSGYVLQKHAVQGMRAMPG